MEPDTESNSALSPPHTHAHTRTHAHTGHKHLSLFLASTGRRLAEGIKPNNRGICLSSRRVPPPHPHMTCPASIHWAARCQPQDGPLPPLLPARPSPPPPAMLATLLPHPLFFCFFFPLEQQPGSPGDMAPSNIHSGHATTTRCSCPPLCCSLSILKGDSEAVQPPSTRALRVSRPSVCLVGERPRLRYKRPDLPD